MSSAEVICSKKLPNITEELSIEANSVNPDQTAPIGAEQSDLGPHCHRGFLNILAAKKSRWLLLQLAL